MNIVEKQNVIYKQLIDLCEIGSFDIRNYHGDAYSFSNESLGIKHDNLEEFNLKLVELYKTFSLEEFISFSFYKQKLIEHIAKKQEASIFMKMLIDLKTRDYKIIRKMHGVILKNNDMIEKGQFTFISTNYIDEYIENNYNDVLLPYFDGDYNCCYVETKCRVNEDLKGKEITDDLYLKLDNIIRYMINNLNKNVCVGVYNFRNPLVNIAAIKFNEMTTSHNSCGEGMPIHPTILDEGMLLGGAEGNDKIWKLASKDNLTELEGRIMMAIDLIGDGVNNLNLTMAFLNFCLALEALLKIDSKEFVTKSITAQLSETVAFIIGNNYNDRLKAEKTVKELYKKRSAIAHGGKKHISERDIWEAFLLTKTVIINLLTEPEYSGVVSMKDLDDIIKSKKYS